MGALSEFRSGRRGADNQEVTTSYSSRVSRLDQRSRVTTWDEKDVDGLRVYFQRAALYPLLNPSTQLPRVFEFYEEEKRQNQHFLATGEKPATSALTELKTDEKFRETIDSLPHTERKKFTTLMTDSASVEQMITLANLGLVTKIASVWEVEFLTYEDRLQAGYEGLVEGIRTWDPKKGKLSAHSAQRIRNHIDYATALAGYPTRIPKDFMWDLRLTQRLRCEFEETHGHPPTKEQEIQLFIDHGGKEGKVSERDLHNRELRAENAVSVHHSGIIMSNSLNEPTSREDQERIDRQADLTTNTESDAMRNLEITRVNAAFSQLSELEAEVLRFHYWKELTQREIAEKLGISPTTVKKIEGIAKRKVEEYLLMRTQPAL